MREIIADDIELVFDVLGARVKWDVPTAIQRFRDFEPYRLKWIEEPLPPHDLDAHARLRRAVSTRIGTGEQEWNLEGYRRLLRSGGVDVVQMDPGRCLGLTGCRQVIRLIEAENLSFTAHTWSGAEHRCQRAPARQLDSWTHAGLQAPRVADATQTRHRSLGATEWLSRSANRAGAWRHRA